jgi:hypothetical protein
LTVSFPPLQARLRGFFTAGNQGYAVGRTFCNAMAKQNFRPTRLGGFSGAKAYIQYVEILKKRRNAVGRTFCDAIKTLVAEMK